MHLFVFLYNYKIIAIFSPYYYYFIFFGCVIILNAIIILDPMIKSPMLWAFYCLVYVMNIMSSGLLGFFHFTTQFTFSWPLPLAPKVLYDNGLSNVKFHFISVWSWHFKTFFLSQCRVLFYPYEECNLCKKIETTMSYYWLEITKNSHFTSWI